MIKITRSDLETFVRCGKKFEYANIKGLRELEETKPVMAEGILGHYGLAAGYTATTVEGFKSKAVSAMADMIRKGTNQYRGQTRVLGLTPDQHSENITRIGDCVQYYANEQVESDFQQYQIISVEREFSTELEILDETVEISGVIDMLALDKTFTHKRVAVIFDHKFPGRIPDEEAFLKLNLQMFIYEYLVHKTLVVDSGEFDDIEFKYNMIRREVPPGVGSRPLRRNQDGSIAKNNASMDRKDYLHRATVKHSSKQRDAIYKNLIVPQLSEFVYATQSGKGYFNRRPIDNGGYACTNCSYFARCAADLVGMGTPKLELVR